MPNQFVFTPLLKEAVDFAAKAHQGQFRKVGREPYIVHPIGVALTLAKLGCSDEIIAAGLLHDVVEDTTITISEVRLKFGEAVAQMVNDVTEQDKSLPWRERKELEIKHIKEMPLESVLVKTADKVNNLASLLDACAKEGKGVFDLFNASLEEMLEVDKKLLLAIKEKWSSNPLLDDLTRLTERLVLVSTNEHN